MKITEYLDSKKRESQKLVDELAAHQAKWPEVQAAFDRADGECIALARDFSAYSIAGSPKALVIAGTLKKKRWERDGIKNAHTIRRDELFRAIDGINAEPISAAREYLLGIVRNLLDKYDFQRLERTHDESGRRVRYTVKISHNGAALERCKDRIFAILGQLDSMQHSTLADIENFVKKVKGEISTFDFQTMIVEEVKPDRAAELETVMRDANSTENVVTASRMPDGSLYISPDTKIAPRLKSLESKIAKMETSL